MKLQKKTRTSHQPNWVISLVVIILAVLVITMIVGNKESEADETTSGAGAEAYYVPNAQAPSSVQTGGTNDSNVVYGGRAWGLLEVGYVGSNKIIEGSSVVKIPRLGTDNWGLVETNVTVKRLDTNYNVFQTLQGKALVFANTRETADVGYIFVNQADSRTWVDVLNGNPSFVFNSSKSNIYPYTIKENITGQEFSVYSLADLAIASGAGGDPPPGDGLTRIRNDLYLKRDGFKATPRPTGSIAPLNARYEIGDQIPIIGSAEAYSIYDRYVQLDGFTVRNATNDTQYTVIEPPGQKGPTWTNGPQGFSAASAKSDQAAAVNDSQQMRSMSLQSETAAVAPEKASISFDLPKDSEGKINYGAIVPEFVDANLTQDAPYTNSQIPSELAQLPKDRVYKIVIQDSPDSLPKVPGTNWTSGTMLQTGWDVAYVLLDSSDPTEGQVPVARFAWETLEIFSAYENPNGTNVIMAKLKEQ